jgi:hypothetical protein
MVNRSIWLDWWLTNAKVNLVHFEVIFSDSSQENYPQDNFEFTAAWFWCIKRAS